MTIAFDLSKIYEKMASASATDSTSADEMTYTFNVNDHIVPENLCRCNKCRLGNILDTLPRQMNQYIRLALPENLPIYRRINFLIDRIIGLMCPKDYCFIKKDFPWDWYQTIMDGVKVENIFDRWQNVWLPSREISIFVDLDTYEKAVEYFEEIRAILRPIFKAIHDAEEEVQYTHPYTRDCERQNIVRECWAKFLETGYVPPKHTFDDDDSSVNSDELPPLEEVESDDDNSSVDSDGIPSLEEVSDIELDDEGEVKFLDTTQADDGNEEEDEDEDEEEEDEDYVYESASDSDSDSDDDNVSDDESVEEDTKSHVTIWSVSKKDIETVKTPFMSLDELYKQGKISVVFNDITDSIKNIDFTTDTDDTSYVTGMKLDFHFGIKKEDIFKNLFKENLESKYVCKK
jgi:hypothetical protein